MLFTVAALVGVARADDVIPRYVVERIEVRHNKKTATNVIKNALLIKPGDTVGADDARVDASRFRILALGFFSDVRLALERGSERGRVVVVVNVSERGTIILNDLWWGSSSAVHGWGGFELSETNFIGRGVEVGGALFLSNAPRMPGSQLQQAYRLRFLDGRLGSTPLSVGATLLYNDASEQYRVAGQDSDPRPENFRAVRYRREGGTAGLGFDLGTFMRILVDYRFERIDAEVPQSFTRTLVDGTEQPIAAGLSPGVSYLSTASFTLVRDTRADPVLTSTGSRLIVANELGTKVIGSSYQFYKFTLQYQHWFRLRWGHVLSVGGLVGIIVGDAPIFDQYYIGDLDPLVPSRALGLSLSTLPGRNFLRSGIQKERYAPLAGRLVVEYSVPLFRRGNFVHGADIFVDLGLLALATYDDLDLSHGAAWSRAPIDLLIDAGVRLDTYIGIFNFSLGNALSRIPY
jgi:outer membrane protein assembly factor BamA